MEILLYILLFITVLVIITLLLPLKIFVRVTGAMDKRFDILGNFMFFSGLFGCGLHYYDGIYMVSIFIHSWKLLTVNVTPMIRYITRKAKKRSKKPVKEKEEKINKTLSGRISTAYIKTFTYWGYFIEGFRDFRNTIRFDRFSAHVTVGLNNPAITGLIAGIIYAVNDLLPRSCTITSSWDFTRTLIRGDLSLNATFLSHLFWKAMIRRFIGIVIHWKRKRKRLVQNTVIA